MESKSTENRGLTGQRVVGLAQEMKILEDWLLDPHAQTQLFSVSGIAGIGKTTLLMEIYHKSRQSSAAAIWLDGKGDLSTSGAFLSSLEMSLESEYGLLRAVDTPLLTYIISVLSRQRFVLVMDNCENLDRIEGWLLSSFLPELKGASVLMIFASRQGLPVKWRMNPYWGARIQAFSLDLLSREEVHEYLRGSGLEVEVQRDIAQQTEGYPLLLALTVDLLRSSPEGKSGKLYEIPKILNAEILREVTTPGLYHALNVLSLLPAADLQLLNQFIPIESSDYYELGRLSFVQATPQGLVLLPVLSRLLRKEYAQRDPEQFQVLRQKVLIALAEKFKRVDKRQQKFIASHVLELYREFLPTAHAYINFSSILAVKEYSPFQSEDLPYLHRFLASSLADHNWQTELARAEDYHALLDAIAEYCPEGICVVRDDAGVPLAFCAGFWLHARTLPLLERYTPRYVSLLGEEGGQLHKLAPEAADIMCVLLAAVNVEHHLYRPEELGALLMQEWLIYMTSGMRAILVTADPQLNSLLPLIGFKQSDKPADSAASVEITKWELDFRQASFGEWVQSLIRQLEPIEEVRVSAAGDEAKPTIAVHEMKQLLRHLFNVNTLEQMTVVQRLNRSGNSMQSWILELLSAEVPQYPLTEQDQRILRDSYVQKGQNKNQLADAYHMSRTTFYRHSQLAMQHLAYVLTYCDKKTPSKQSTK